MIYMLFDNPEDKASMEFLYDYKTAGIKQIYPSHKCSGSIKDMIRECDYIIRESKENDTILCWYDFMGILCWWICKIKRKKRKIVVINILLKDKTTLKNRIAKVLYKAALKSQQIYVTVTSKEYGLWINKILNINKEYIVLHDIYHKEYEVNCKKKVRENTVFCGGRNGRNWEMVLKIARELPNVNFICIMPLDEYAKYKNNITSNVQVQCDVPKDVYMESMCQSQLVIMPINTEAPAGLIALFQACANDKPIIVSDTVTMKEYFSNNRGYMCGDDIEEWKNTIENCLNNKEKATEMTNNLKRFLKEECSEEKYADTIAKICEL